MSNDIPTRPVGTHLPLALLALTIALFLVAQIVAAGQQSSLISFQLSNGAKQIEAAKQTKTQLNQIIEQQAVLVDQSFKVQQEYQKLLDDLLSAADKDPDAKTIVEKWKIQRNKPADKPATEEKR